MYECNQRASVNFRTTNQSTQVILRDRYYQLCCVMIEKVGHRQVLSIIIDSRYAMTYVADFVLCSGNSCVTSFQDSIYPMQF